MASSYDVLLARNIDNTQRALIHEMVKKISAVWWHEYPDIWIMKSDQSVTTWRNWLSNIVPLQPSTILVMHLGENPQYDFASFGVVINLLRWFQSVATSNELGA
jgi:hypothetical protein